MDKSKKRTKCEVYSRIIGYIRPVSNWNEGKRSEWSKRVTYSKLGK
ncbi:MAG: anaerobic ribonucleoside-triphosphate reductase [bacterium]